MCLEGHEDLGSRWLSWLGLPPLLVGLPIPNNTFGDLRYHVETASATALRCGTNCRVVRRLFPSRHEHWSSEPFSNASENFLFLRSAPQLSWAYASDYTNGHF